MSTFKELKDRFPLDHPRITRGVIDEMAAHLEMLVVESYVVDSKEDFDKVKEDIKLLLSRYSEVISFVRRRPGA